MEISNDDFIRTTDPDHIKRVQAIFMEMYEKGDVYKGKYEGWYCTPCESFWTESQLGEGHTCPDCKRPVEKADEDAYFFRLSKYEDALLKYYDEHPDFLQPEARKNEMIAFIKQGLDDLCISRSTFSWGIPVPIEEGHVIYVWLDALTNYITDLGYPDSPEKYKKYWPADVHLVGKEIVRFHSIIWPAILMSIGQPLPKQVRGHGWLLIDGGKMSKSKGNVVDPVVLIKRYGVDALKYFLLREYTFGQDGVFTNELLLQRINFDLANDLGNLLSRTVTMIEKYCDSKVPAIHPIDDKDEDLKRMALEAADIVSEKMDNFCFNLALEEIWKLIGRANKYIDEKMPWKLAKDPDQKENLDTCLGSLYETLRIVSILIYPFMHTTSEKMRAQLGLSGEVLWEDAYVFGRNSGQIVKRGENLFPRLDIEKELKELDALREKQKQEAEAEQKEKNQPLDLKPEISFDEFDKLDLRVGEIIEAKKHPNADRLLVFQVKMGSETRQVISGVADDFKPEDMVGKKVIVVANLKARKLRGMESKGMILFADGSKGLELVTTEAEDGNEVN